MQGENIKAGALSIRMRSDVYTCNAYTCSKINNLSPFCLHCSPLMAK